MIEHLTGNALNAVKTIAPGTVQTCVTSPPYWKLMDYGEATVFEWPAVRWIPMIGCEPRLVPAWIGKLGDERDPNLFIAHLVAIFRAVREALTETGTLWVNLGDSYAANGGGAQGLTGVRNNRRFTAKGERKGSGIPLKNLAGIPWRLAFALQDGMTPADIPDDAVVLFVGGTTKWKWRSLPTWASTGRRVHVGRVNEVERLLICERFGVESVDGTGWMKGTDGGRQAIALAKWMEGTIKEHPCMI